MPAHPHHHPCRPLFPRSEWSESFSFDFRDPRMMQPLKDIFAVLVRIDPEAKTVVQSIERTLTTKVCPLGSDQLCCESIAPLTPISRP